MQKCLYCNRFIQNKIKLADHLKLRSAETGLCPAFIPKAKGPKKGSVPWNKGLSKETDLRLRDSGRRISLVTKGMKRNISPEVEKQRREKLRLCAIKGKYGGLKEGSGRGKGGWYRGYYCYSSWELAFVIFHLDHSIPIQRCTQVRTYPWLGYQRRYFPDFIVEGKVIEIKGFLTPQWAAKHKANPDVICLLAQDIEPYLKYVRGVYGKDYVRLYE